MSDEPVIAARQPCVMQLKAGDYWWCACGRSKNQPFCDGGHAGTSFSPLKFTLESDTTMALCACKHTGHAPKCDGMHSKLP
jgi:CDGSH-type Zn-finger protein